jgi:hypothetical protein
MNTEDTINLELSRLNLLPLAQEQLLCLRDPAHLEEAAGMLADLQDRRGVHLPIPAGTPLGGPYDNEDEARKVGQLRSLEFPVVAVDRMATDESRSTGLGDEYYVTGHTGPEAAVALALEDQWEACWVQSQERTPEIK